MKEKFEYNYVDSTLNVEELQDVTVNNLIERIRKLESALSDLQKLCKDKTGEWHAI